MNEITAVLNTAKKSAWDVIVVGATDHGVLAAIHAARNGASVLLISENARYGGLTGWGINHPDINESKTPGAIGSAAREFFARMAHNEYTEYTFKAFYRAGANSRPSWARRVFEQMVADSKIEIAYNAPLRAVTKSGTTIISVRCGDFLPKLSDTYTASVYIDATACGDLARMYGLSGNIGREATSLYSETSVGVLSPAAWDGSAIVDPYVTPATPASGLLYGIDPGINGDGTAPETVGSGDGRVMTFNYRLYFTSGADKILWTTFFVAGPPTGYAASKYELLGRAMADKPAYFGDATLGLDRVMFFNNLNPGVGTTMGGTFYPRADVNSFGAITTDYPNTAECLEYVSATPERRAVIEANAKNWLLGLIYWLMFSGDSRIPAVIVTALNGYGFSNSELVPYGGVSPVFYAREGFRTVGDFVLTQQNAKLTPSLAYTDPIAFGFYPYDSKPVRRVVVSGVAKLEGTSNIAPIDSEFGYRIPYRVLLPKVSECINMLVPGAPSVSQYVWRSVRATACMFQLGSAAGVAAALAAREGTTVQAVDITRLLRIVDIYETYDGIVLSTDGSFASGTITLAGTTSTAASRFGFIGNTFRTVAAATAGSVKFQHNIRRNGLYRVFALYPPDITTAGLRATNVAVTISHANGTTSLVLNQQYPLQATDGGWWVDLGQYFFRAGGPSADFVTFDNTSGDGVMAISAVKLTPVDMKG